MLRFLSVVLFVIAFAGALATVGSALAPKLAPSMMSMETMDRAFGIGRYQDQGACDFWVVNMSRPTERIEKSFSCGFFWDWSVKDAGYAYVHEALIDHETGLVFQVPNMARGNLEEWYHVDGHMLTPGALRFALADAGVLMPPPGARDRLVMGWVQSDGLRGGPQTLVHPRELVDVGEEDVLGVRTVKWTSSFERVPTRWHGYDAFLTEQVEMWSDPRTAWILKMHRHVVVEMTPSQMAAASGVPPPAPLPDGFDEPQPVMELVYDTTAEGAAAHAEETRFFQALVTPIEEWRTFVRQGVGATFVAAFAGLALWRIASWRQRAQRPVAS